MKNEYNFNDLTFLVCIKGRKHCTDRLVNYINTIDTKLNFFFADGSEFHQREIINKVSKNHNVNYEKFEYDKDFDSFIKKIYLSLKKIKTKFFCFWDTDDFLNIEKVFFHLEFLKNNRDYVCSIGKIVNFNLVDNSSIELIGDQYSGQKTSDFKKKFVFDDFSCWEALHYTEKMLKILKSVSEAKFNDIRNISGAINQYFQILGKMNYSADGIFILRQANTSSYSYYDIEKNTSSGKLQAKVRSVSIWKFLNILKSYKIYKIILLESNFRKKYKLFFSYYIYYFKNLFKFNIINDVKKIFFFVIRKIGFTNVNLKTRNFYKIQNEEESSFYKSCEEMASFGNIKNV